MPIWSANLVDIKSASDPESIIALASSLLILTVIMIGHGIHLLKSLAYAIVHSIVSKLLKFVAIECISTSNSWVYVWFPKVAHECNEFSLLVSVYMCSNNLGTNISSVSNDSKLL